MNTVFRQLIRGDCASEYSIYWIVLWLGQVTFLGPATKKFSDWIFNFIAGYHSLVLFNHVISMNIYVRFHMVPLKCLSNTAFAFDNEPRSTGRCDPYSRHGALHNDVIRATSCRNKMINLVPRNQEQDICDRSQWCENSTRLRTQTQSTRRYQKAMLCGAKFKSFP